MSIRQVAFESLLALEEDLALIASEQAHVVYLNNRYMFNSLLNMNLWGMYGNNFTLKKRKYVW